VTDDQPADQPQPPYAEPSAPPVRGAPKWLVVVSLVAAFVLMAILILDRLHLGDKVLTAPGGTIDIEPIVDVSGVESFPNDAEISLVTVRSNLDPSVLELIGGWFDDSIRVQDRADVLGDRSIDENRTLGQQQMAQSLDIATRVALERLGYDVITEAGALIMAVSEDTPAEDVLSRGDVVIAAQDDGVLTSADLVAAVRELEPGDDFTFTVLEIDGDTRDETVTLAERDGGAFLGVSIGTFVDMEDLPFDLDVDIQRIGGPSAGLALTLTVLDLLTDGELTAGLDIVTTGTIDPLGNVGPIGGIEQKSHAVLRSGADLFIVPSNDLESALAVIGDRIDVVGVDTLDQALDALEERGADVLAIDRLALDG
jgi:Lon-like protease